MHTYTIAEVSAAAVRLYHSGMGLKHAVLLAAGAHGFDPEEVYLYIAKHNPEL